MLSFFRKNLTLKLDPAATVDRVRVSGAGLPDSGYRNLWVAHSILRYGSGGRWITERGLVASGVLRPLASLRARQVEVAKNLILAGPAGPNLGAFVGKLPRHKAVLCACRTIPERESIWDTELEGWDLEQTGLPTQGIKSTTDKFSRNLESSSSLGHGQR